MSRNVLITGGSGYLGGSVLAELKKTDDLPAHGTIYALVRSEEQAQKVKAYTSATPITLDLEDQSAITSTLVDKKISVVFFLINALTADAQLKLIQALKEVQDQLGVTTHFLHTTGAKAFSAFTSHPTDRVLSDADDELFAIQNNAKPAKPAFAPFEKVGWASGHRAVDDPRELSLIWYVQAVGTNCKVIEAGEKYGVKTYIYIPCIVYGEGTGFGNRISIQTVAIVRAAKAMRRVCKVDNENGVSLHPSLRTLPDPGADLHGVLAGVPYLRYRDAIHYPAA